MKKLVLMGLMAMSIGCLAHYMDADNFQEAIDMAAVDVRATDGIRQRCTNLLPEKALDIHSLSLYWLDQNKKEYLAVKAYSQHAASEWRSAVERTAALENSGQAKLPQYVQIQYCKGYFGSIKSGDQDIAKKTPRVSRFLIQYLSKNPLPEKQKALEDVVFGCMKQGNNRAIESKIPFDLDQTRAFCECVGSVYVSNTTQEEREAEGKSLAEGRGITDLPHAKRVAPLYQSCTPHK